MIEGSPYSILKGVFRGDRGLLRGGYSVFEGWLSFVWHQKKYLTRRRKSKRGRRGWMILANVEKKIDAKYKITRINDPGRTLNPNDLQTTSAVHPNNSKLPLTDFCKLSTDVQTNLPIKTFKCSFVLTNYSHQHLI